MPVIFTKPGPGINYESIASSIVNDSSVAGNTVKDALNTLTASGGIDHGNLTGLIDDDHTQYILSNGSRAFTGNIQANASGTLDIGSLTLPFKDLYLTGSSLYLDGIKTLYTIGNNIVLASPDGSIVISGSVNLSDAVINHDELTGLSDPGKSCEK